MMSEAVLTSTNTNVMNNCEETPKPETPLTMTQSIGGNTFKIGSFHSMELSELNTVRLNDLPEITQRDSNVIINSLKPKTINTDNKITTSQTHLMPNKLNEPDNLSFDIACLYLNDVLHIRPPQKKIRLKSDGIFGLKIVTPIRCYKIIKSWIWGHLIYIIIWCYMWLSVFEPPNYNTNNIDGIRDNISHIPRWTKLVQIYFIIMIAIDVSLRMISHDKKFVGKWVYLIMFLLLFNIILVILSFFISKTNKQFIGLYLKFRVTRPLYLFYKSRDLKKLSRSILQGLPSLFEVVLLIILTLMMFGFVGYTFFYESGLIGKNPNFKDFGASFYNLLVLTTTANFPDIMMPSYTEHESAFIFFFIFNVIGIYFLMSLVLAVVYNNYSDHITKNVEKIVKIRNYGVKQAFRVLTYHQNHESNIHSSTDNLLNHNKNKKNKKRNNNNNINGSKTILKKSSKKYIEVIYYNTFLKLMKSMRPDIKNMVSKSYEWDEQILYIYIALTGKDYIPDDPTSVDYGIDWIHFKRIVSFMDIEIEKDIAKAKRYSIMRKQRLNANILSANKHKKRFTMENMKICWYRVRLFLISFWQWKKEIKICSDKMKHRISFSRRNTSSFVTHDRKATGGNIKFMKRANNGDMPMSPNTISKLRSALDDNNVNSIPNDDKGWNYVTISTNQVVNILVVVSTVLVVVDVYNPGKYDAIALAFVYIFLIEVVLKIIAFGFKGYLSDNFNKLDFVISVSAFVLEVILANTIRIVIIFRMIRMLRILRAFTRFRVILRTTKAVLQSFTGLFVLEFCLTYIYSIIGMELFGGLINKNITETLCLDEVNANPDPLVAKFWCNIYDGYYYNNNFNSFTESLVIQMELIVVNNWYVTNIYLYICI